MGASVQVFVRDDGGNRTRRARLKGELPNHLPRRHVVDPPGIEPGRRPSESRVASLRSEPWCHRQDSNLQRPFRKRIPIRSGSVALEIRAGIEPAIALLQSAAFAAWLPDHGSGCTSRTRTRRGSKPPVLPIELIPIRADSGIRTRVTALPGRETSHCLTSAKWWNHGDSNPDHPGADRIHSRCAMAPRTTQPRLPGRLARHSKKKPLAKLSCRCSVAYPSCRWIRRESNPQPSRCHRAALPLCYEPKVARCPALRP